MSLGLTRLGICVRPIRPGLVAAPTSVTTGASAVAATPPISKSLPTISAAGPLVDGTTLIADHGNWGGQPHPTFTYQWKANGIAIDGATAKTYVLNGNYGSDITVQVMGKNTYGAAYATSMPLSIPAFITPPTPDMSSPPLTRRV